MRESGTTYTLRAPAAPATVPTLDGHQRRVVDHAGGPLLVLAGPGTGKTTTLVEAIVDRIEHRGAAPESVLALTFSRKAAEQLRDRVTARLGRTTASTLSSTFHSFAYGLVRRHAPAALYDAPLRLLSAPEQDVVLRELLRESPESVRWPEWLDRAAGTRGFAQEVSAVLARAREKGLDPWQLRALGEQEAVPELVAAGLFLEQYLTVLDAQGSVDYPDLIRRAVIEAEAHRDELRAEFRHVFVDEYQDTDPGQVALLQAIAGDGRDLVAVGDPHQSIYGFRGADVRGILDFPASFPRVDGSRADVVVLRTTRRFGPALLGVSRSLARRLPLGGSIDEESRTAFLSPVAAESEGCAHVFTYDTERAEIERVADLLRRAHLEDGVPWSQMAVLVRSGRTSIPVLRRGLSGAGVPVEVAADETPLVREPALAPLLAALRAVVHLDDDPASVDHVSAEDVAGLLVSPMVGLDAADVRALARAVRRRDQELAVAEDRSPRSSAELVREAVLDPARLAGLDVPAAGRVRSFATLLHRARAALDGGETAEEVLWELWSGSGWGDRLRHAVERGGSAARRAHRDLDAICALFEIAAKVEEQRGHTSVDTFLATLAAQQIPADTLAERGVRGEGVRLLTAHRSKGLEWDLVVVAHVQEDGWPDLRRRSSLLGADRIGSARYGEPVLLPPVTARELLAEERRLFFVACTRARKRLVITAVRSPEEDGEQPSRFLEETGVKERHRSGRPPKPLTLAGVVAELRRTVASAEQPVGLRHAAAARLARLAAEGVTAADPAHWWGLRDWTAAPEPLRPVDEPVRLSASTVTSIGECPARWFLEREAGGARASTQAQGFGLVVHTLAERVTTGEIEQAAVEDLMAHVDAVWDQLAFRTPWSSERERAEVRKALERFLHQHQASGNRVLGTELELRSEVKLPDGQVVVLHGYADRVEVDAAGDLIVVDLKTTKSHPTGRQIDEHPQLGLYQHAVNNGALDELEGHTGRAAGAELWQLRHANKSPGAKVQQQKPQQPDGEGWLQIERQLATALDAVRGERFPATPGDQCRYCSFRQLCPAQVSGTVLS